MGLFFSTLYKRFWALYIQYSSAFKRSSLSPGIPLPNPTCAYWTVPSASISQCGADSETIPQDADIVIIGSGITGTSIVRALLKESGPDSRLRVVMLEARDICSGATARNGGHITPAWYHHYEALLEEHGRELAHQLISFHLSHIQELITVAEEEDLVEASQCRLVDSFDVYTSPNGFAAAKKDYERYLKDLGSSHEVTRILETKEQFEELQLNSDVSGVIGTVLGVVHPYRLITGILSRLLKEHSNFQIFSHTPCTSIITSTSDYILSTPKGNIRATHVIHATNAWASHLLPGFRHKIVPIPGQMSSQRPGLDLGSGLIPVHPSTVAPDSSNWQSSRSFVFYPKDNDIVYEYLTQQPTSSSSSTYPAPQGEMMYGAGAAVLLDSFLELLGSADDTKLVSERTTYLSGTLPSHFGRHWGEEGRSTSSDVEFGWNKGRAKAVWSGIMGFSVDGCPWVGKVPAELSGRVAVVGGGEWICAGYSGEGMVNAWRCGVALARMVFGKDTHPEWLPKPFGVSVERHKNARFEELLKHFL